MILPAIEAHITSRLQAIKLAGVDIHVHPFIPERELKEIELPAFAFQRHEIFVRDEDIQPYTDIQYPGHGTVTGTTNGPFTIVTGKNDGFSMLVGDTTYELTLPSGSQTTTEIATFLNQNIDDVLCSSSANSLRITSSLAYQGLAILNCDNDSYATLGLTTDWIDSGVVGVDNAYISTITTGGYDSYTFRKHPSPVDILYEIQTLAAKKSHADYLNEIIYQVIPPSYRPNIQGQFPTFCYGKPVTHNELEKPFFRSAYMMEVCGVWIDRIENTEFKSAQSIGMILEPTEDVNG